MTKPPLLLRTGEDPLAAIRTLTDTFDALADDAISRAGGPERRPDGPLLLLTAAAIDGYRMELADVELLGDSELSSAAARAGVGAFDLGSAQAEELRGALTALRGAAGEEWVLDRLNSGALAAPLHARSAELLAFTAPGTDIRFANVHGDVVSQANVKIASTASVIIEHFERHPDVPIVYASSDAAAAAARHGFEVVSGSTPFDGHRRLVVDIGRSSVDFDHEIASHLPSAAHLEGVTSIADLLDDIPWLSMGVISLRALRRLQAGGSRAAVARAAGRDATVAMAGAGASHLAASVTSSEPSVALISMVAASLTYGALEVRKGWTEASSELRLVTESAEEIADRYHPNPSEPPLTWWRRLEGIAVGRLRVPGRPNGPAPSDRTS